MRKTKLGSLIREVKTKIANPRSSYTYFVAGDHMDTEDIHIRRRGIFADTAYVGPAFIRLFESGQVLYGSRRTYLKKVAVADFEGITSNTTFVLETKDECKLTQLLLPFILLSDDFTTYSIKKSKGSTNPYILFSDICEYELTLPPIEKQRELAHALLAIDRTIESYRTLLKKCDDIIKSRFVEMFGTIESPNNDVEAIPLSLLGECIAGATPSTKVPSYWNEGAIPWLTSGEVEQGRIFQTSSHITKEGYDACSTRMLPKKSVCIAMAGQGKTRGFVGITEIELCTNQSICGIKANPGINSDFLFWDLRFQYERLRVASNGDSGRGGLNLAILEKFTILWPSETMQESFVGCVNCIDKLKFDFRISSKSQRSGKLYRKHHYL